MKHSTKSRHRLRKIPAIIASCAVMASGIANADTNVSAEIESLKKRITELEATQIEASGAGVEIVDNKNDTSFEVNGRLHLDADLFDGAYNSGNDGATASDIFARRARLAFKGDNGNWHYKATLKFGGDRDATLHNAVLSYNGFKNNGGPQINIGLVKEDMTLDVTTSSKDTTGISRPMITNAVHPSHNWGVRINQFFKEQSFGYAFGVYENTDAGDNGQDAEGSTLLAYTGRAFWSPIAEKDSVFHLGLWGSHRDYGGSELDDRVARGEVRATGTRLLNYAAGGSAVEVDSVSQYGVELASVVGPFSIQAEYVERTADAAQPGGFEPELDGYYATASYFLTGESRRYDKKKGRFKQPKGVEGAWEVMARFSNGDATSATQGTSVDVITVGANYYVNPSLRFSLNYLNADVEGPGAFDLVGDQSSGDAITFRTFYRF